MTPRALVVAVVAVVLAATCVRMAAWQVSRWQDKRRGNAALHAALAAPPVPVGAAEELGRAPADRRVRLEGTFDDARTVLVSDRWLEEQPGVEVFTPMRLAAGGTVLVDRGWLPSADAISARPQDHAEPGPLALTGLRVAVPRGVRNGAWTRLAGEAPAAWSARALDADTLRARLPDALAGWLVRALPDSVARTLPRRLAPEPADEGMHLSYALQWTLFAIAFLAGAVLVFVRERAAGGARR